MWLDGSTTLSTKEAEVLRYFVIHPRRTIGRDELLKNVWGYARPAATRAVDNVVTRLRGKVEVDPRDPHFIMTVYGEGYRFEPPKQDAPGAGPGRRPRRADRFFGRDGELGKLCEHVKAGALVTVVGPGGAGKSRLVAEWVRPHESASVVVDLERARGDGDLVRVVREALDLGGEAGTDESGESDELRALGHVIAGREAQLLILDGCEGVLEIVRRSVTAWRELAPGLGVLATSRVPLRLDDEVVLPLGPLALDTGLSLFEDRVGSVGADEAGSVRELVERLDGSPLAIELAAGRAGLMSASQLVEQLERRLDLLSASDDRDRRHASLRVTLDASWALLEESRQRALAWLSVFPSQFTAPSAAELLGREGMAHLEALRSCGLVQAIPTAGRSRGLRLLETVRLYAVERLVERCEVEEAEATHAAMVLRRAEQHVAELEALWRAECMGALGEEIDDLLVAFDRQLKRDPAQAGRIARCIDAYLAERGPMALRLDTIRRAVRALGDRSELAFTLRLHLGMALYQVGSDVAAESHLLAALDSEAMRTRYRATEWLGALRMRQARLDEARELLEAAIARCGVDEKAAASPRNLLALVLRRAGDIDGSFAQLERALAALEESPPSPTRSGIRLNLGSLALMRGDRRRARFELGEGLEEARAAGLRSWEVRFRIARVGQMVDAGRLDEAGEEAEAALALARTQGARASEVVVQHFLALIATDQGRFDDAERWLMRIDASQRRCKDLRIAGTQAAALAMLDHERGDLRGAEEGYEESLAKLESAERSRRKLILLPYAMLLAETGRADSAARLIEEETFATGWGTALERVRVAIAIARGADGAVATAQRLVAGAADTRRDRVLSRLLLRILAKAA